MDIDFFPVVKYILSVINFLCVRVYVHKCMQYYMGMYCMSFRTPVKYVTMELDEPLLFSLICFLMGRKFWMEFKMCCLFIACSFYVCLVRTPALLFLNLDFQSGLHSKQKTETSDSILFILWSLYPTPTNICNHTK